MRTRLWLYGYMALCLMLVIFKACGTVDWPWVASLAPIWVPVLVTVSLAFIVFVMASMLAMIGED